MKRKNRKRKTKDYEKHRTVAMSQEVLGYRWGGFPLADGNPPGETAGAEFKGAESPGSQENDQRAQQRTEMP